MARNRDKISWSDNIPSDFNDPYPNYLGHSRSITYGKALAFGTPEYYDSLPENLQNRVKDYGNKDPSLVNQGLASHLDNLKGNQAGGANKQTLELGVKPETARLLKETAQVLDATGKRVVEAGRATSLIGGGKGIDGLPARSTVTQQFAHNLGATPKTVIPSISGGGPGMGFVPNINNPMAGNQAGRHFVSPTSAQGSHNLIAGFPLGRGAGGDLHSYMNDAYWRAGQKRGNDYAQANIVGFVKEWGARQREIQGSPRTSSMVAGDSNKGRLLIPQRTHKDREPLARRSEQLLLTQGPDFVQHGMKWPRKELPPGFQEPPKLLPAGQGFTYGNTPNSFINNLKQAVTTGVVTAYTQIANKAGAAGRGIGGATPSIGQRLFGSSYIGGGGRGVAGFGSTFGGQGGLPHSPSGPGGPGGPSPSTGGFGSNLITRLGRAATWAAYAPVFAGVGAVGGLALGTSAAQQEEARATIALTGVNYTNEMAKEAMHHGRVRAIGRPMSQSSDHIRAEYEIASLIKATPESQQSIRGSAAFASKYQLFSQETFKAGTQNLARWMSMFKHNPRYRHLSETGILEEVGGVAALAIQESSAKGKDLSTELATSGGVMSNLGLSAGTMFGMGTKLRDLGTPDAAISTTFSKLGTKMPTSLARMRFIAEHEAELRAKGLHGRDTYMAEKYRSEFSQSKGAKATVRGVPGYQYVRQMNRKIDEEFRTGTPAQQRALIYEWSKMVEHYRPRGNRWMQIAGVSEQAIPVLSRMAGAGVIEDMETRIARLDSGTSKAEMDKAYAEQYKPVSMGGESATLWTGITSAVSSGMERIGAHEYVRKNWTEPLGAGVIVGGQDKFLDKKDWGGLINYHKETYKDNEHAPDLQAEIMGQTGANLSKYVKDNSSVLHPQSGFAKDIGEIGFKLRPKEETGASYLDAIWASVGDLRKLWDKSVNNRRPSEMGKQLRNGEFIGTQLGDFFGLVNQVSATALTAVGGAAAELPWVRALPDYLARSSLLTEDQRKLYQTSSNTPVVPMTPADLQKKANSAPTNVDPTGTRQSLWASTWDQYDPGESSGATWGEGGQWKGSKGEKAGAGQRQAPGQPAMGAVPPVINLTVNLGDGTSFKAKVPTTGAPNKPAPQVSSARTWGN